MPLSAPASPRQPLHTRSIRVQSYAREDGLWDLDAELVDTKAYDFPVQGGRTHEAGAPVHHMHLRVTIDDQFTITDAQVAYDAAPYGEFCSAIAPDYRHLIGLNLLKQFRKHVRERFGRTAGCTHVTELTNVLPTAAVQTMAGRRRENPDGQRPFQLDGCHALRVDGPVVREHYAPWYVSPDSHHEG
ncbi:DUF2889 domain-containing protein [Castellaniella sp.]|uniref:DUF2889 domain-containing protein n=1 Tax=Castellaniella sp. TaxID=1955812 RepID=UPI002AFF4168|nr:DUF2889 domain-containing protein [Castellaniella sp.]